MKIERLISIIMILLKRELVSATELAKTFEVTTRTIYRDVETLTMAISQFILFPDETAESD